VTDQPGLTRVLAAFAGHLVNDYDAVDVLSELVGISDALALAGAGVSLDSDGAIRYVTAANERTGSLERTQEAHQAGPGIDAHRSGRIVLVSDLAAAPGRWNALTKHASEAGIVAAAGFPIVLDGTSLGGLSLYDDSWRDWSEDDVGAVKLLVEVATGYVANAARIAQMCKTAQQLQGALDSRVIIEQAKGVLAGEGSISVDAAFELLRGHARSHNTSLRQVADAVVNRGLRP
jgi:GAF domain-containing protein